VEAVEMAPQLLKMVAGRRSQIAARATDLPARH
jgi:hypothetical protein